jgi:hypothetical protein
VSTPPPGDRPDAGAPAWLPPEQPAPPGTPGGPAGWGASPPPPTWTTGPGQAAEPGQPAQAWQPGQQGRPGAGWSQVGQQAPAYGSVLVRRGIVPLKPLGFSDFFDGSFRAIRHNPRVMVGLTALVIGITNVVVTLPLTGALAAVGFGTDPEAELSDAQLTGFVGGLAAFVPASFLQAMAIVVLTGMLILSVTQSVVDRRIGLGELWRRARGRVLPLVGWSVLQSVGFALLIGVALAPGLALFVAEELLLGTVALVALVLLAVVVALWLTTVLAFVPVVIVVERLGLVAAVRRSYGLVRGSFWKVLGILLLTGVLASIVSQVLSTPFAVVGSIALVALESQPVLAATVYAASVVLGSTVGLVLAVPFLAAVVALLYVDRRIRLEGLDVALSRVLEDEQA